MNEWTIYYADGSRYSSKDGPVENAPGHQAQVIGWYDFADPKLIRGKDFYVWTPAGWVGMDIIGLVTSYYHKPGWQKVIVGSLMPDSDAYWDLCKRALNERP